MKNPYIELHKEFRNAGAKVLISSGQACVLYGIAAFSKDGDWIIDESAESCGAVLKVLSIKNASYRLGAPLDPIWLKKGLTSHFEYEENGIRIRTDFCSRPPRISDINQLWSRAVSKKSIEIIDVYDLIRVKQTRLLRDYAIIGALAEAIGLNGSVPELAIEYLQDYMLLCKSIERWPDAAARSSRPAVQLILCHASRQEIVNALAQEQDTLISADQARIGTMLTASSRYQEKFMEVSKGWKQGGANLYQQHSDLLNAAREFQDIPDHD